MNIQINEKPKRATVKLGVSRQIVIPKRIHDELDLEPGDFLDVELIGGRLVVTPKSLIDKSLADGLADIKAGRTIGPFSNTWDALDALHNHKNAS